MQSRAGRIGLIAAALAVAVVAFLVLRPSEEGPEQTQSVQQTEGAPPSGSEPGGGNGSQGGVGSGNGGSNGQQSRPDVPTIEFRDGEPVGGVEEIEAESGETLEFVVESDTPDEIHVHGYEITKRVAPNHSARFSFPADLEGAFEVEMHDAGHVLIAELRVTP